MKHMWKKNQVIITALAAMVAVAGYLNYSGTKLGGKTLPASTSETDLTLTDAAGTDGSLILTDTADGELYLGEETLTPDAEADVSAANADDAELADAAADDAEADVSAANAGDAELAEASGETGSDLAEEVTDTPGEAVLTSTPNAGTFAAQARLTREQVRAKSKETLLEIVNNANVTEEQRQNAVNSMTVLTENAEKEAAAELLLESKGFTDAVVSITDGTADVVVGQTELSDAQRAQIEDIVKRKTEIPGEQVVITTMRQSGE